MTYRDAVLAGSMTASRLHRARRTREQVETQGGNVDIFGTINSLGIPLILRPLRGLLGAYLDNPVPGILVTTERRMAVQRFTAAHELGHSQAGHKTSLDDEGFLSRALTQPASPSFPTGDFQEVEADAFAVDFLVPRWLISWHADRQKWRTADFESPEIVYQLSLRLGISYVAACWTLSRHKWLPPEVARRLSGLRPRAFKIALLDDYRPAHYRGDVWLLTENDAGLQIDGSWDDHFVLRLEEHSGGGYIWNIDQLSDSGFAIVNDERKNHDEDGIGGHVVRSMTARLDEPALTRYLPRSPRLDRDPDQAASQP